MRRISNIKIWPAAISFCLLTASQSMVAAEFYKWKDENGNTVYSRNPPPGNVETETVKTVARANTESARKDLQEEIERVDAMRENRLKEAEEEQKAQEDLAFKQENCRRARTRVNSYSVPYARIVMEDGSQVRPDEETRLQRLEQARKEVDEWCD